MLRLACLFAGVGLLALATTSCSTSYDASPDVPGKDTIKNFLRGEFTALVDGVQFTADMKQFSDNTTEGVRSLGIVGNQFSYNKDPKNYSVITLTINNYTGPNTYLIDRSITNGGYSSVIDGLTSIYFAKAGDSLSTITITNDGDKVEGSFNFIVAPNGSGEADNHVISSGSFSIPR